METFDEIFFKYRYPLLILLVGLILLGIGFIYFKKGDLLTDTKVEVLQTTTEPQNKNEIVVEISGSVEKPGVYKVTNDKRVDDILIMSGGLTADADRVWTDKYLNRASKVTDGQKIFIPKIGEQSKVLSAKTGGGDQTASSINSTDSNGQININTASLKELDGLPGIGQVYGQNIIEHRPYSNVEELVSKGALKKGVYEKIKDQVTIY